MAKMICFHLYHWILSSHYLTYTIVKLTLLTYSKTIEAVLVSINMKSLLCLQAFLWFMTSFNITLAVIDLRTFINHVQYVINDILLLQPWMIRSGWWEEG